jgi:hypothetical protein
MGIPNNYQFAYQADKSCALASFVLQETISHNVERGSKVYCCFLDSSKAFDSVWLDGLFYKLFQLGMNGKSWRILRNWYSKMHCYVSLNGQTSSVFPVLQGVRQGGVLSPWLFLCYNNDIPDVLQSADYGLSVQDINCSSVLVADDVTLLSLRIKGLQSLLAKMEMYSYQWRFEFNPSKTTIVTFGETTQMHLLKKPLRSWYINGVKISEKPSWEHVGIMLSGNFSNYERSKIAASKGKQAAGMLMNAGVRPGGLNPICGMNSWKTFGLPSMLYGAEVWSAQTITELDLLNRAGAFAAKRLQGLAPTTATAGALGTVGLWSITGFIDKKKLLFLGTLCRSSPSQLHKKIFVYRLFSFIYYNELSSVGYVADIVEVLGKYELYHYLEDYIKTGMFPNKRSWRNYVVKAIDEHETECWKDKMQCRPNLKHLRENHQKLQPIVHWEVAMCYPKDREILSNLVNVLVGNVPSIVMKAVEDHETHYICSLCNKQLYDVPYHFIMDCQRTSQERDKLWDSLTDQLSIQEICYLYNLCEVDVYSTLLSGNHPMFRNDKEELYLFLLISARGIMDIFLKINNLLD